MIVCSFTSTDELRGKSRTYANLKMVVLRVGRFSTFEATQSDKDARMFTKLCRDPDLETFDMGFPWTGVRKSVRTVQIESALVAISMVWT